MLKLKLQHFGHLMQRANSLEKTLILGKIEGRRRRRHEMRWLDGITNSMDMNFIYFYNFNLCMFYSQSPALVGSRDSLGRTALAKRIEIEKEIRKEFCS